VLVTEVDDTLVTSEDAGLRPMTDPCIARLGAM
jgi:hypothetical protein